MATGTFEHDAACHMIDATSGHSRAGVANIVEKLHA